MRKNPAATIVVDPANPLTHDARWLDHGLPYHISGPNALRVGDSMSDAPPVTLTLDPGVTLRFDAAGSILLNARRTSTSPSVDVSNGTLIAAGTAALPITLEGITPTPGSWRGVVFAAGEGANTGTAKPEDDGGDDVPATRYAAEGANDLLTANRVQTGGAQVSFDDGAIKKIIHAYTRESGVRNLEREIGTCARKAAIELLKRVGEVPSAAKVAV
jgi:hypothetical protein